MLGTMYKHFFSLSLSLSLPYIYYSVLQWNRLIAQSYSPKERGILKKKIAQLLIVEINLTHSSLLSALGQYTACSIGKYYLCSNELSHPLSQCFLSSFF